MGAHNDRPCSPRLDRWPRERYGTTVPTAVGLASEAALHDSYLRPSAVGFIRVHSRFPLCVLASLREIFVCLLPAIPPRERRAHIVRAVRAEL